MKMKNNLLLFLFLISTVAASTTAPTMIDVYPAATYANFSIILNDTGNVSIAYGNTTAFGSFSNDSTQALSHILAITGLSVNTDYYYAITACDSEYNCTTSATSVFQTLFIQEVNPATERGTELLVLVIILALAIFFSVFGLEQQRVFFILVGATLLFISGYYLFSGITISFGLASGAITQVFFSDTYLKAIGVGLILVSFYLYIRIFMLLANIFGNKSGREDD